MAAATKRPVFWHQIQGHADNHNYKLDDDGTQRCHLCGAVEEISSRADVDERTLRAAAHLVHAVREHYDTTIEEWNA